MHLFRYQDLYRIVKVVEPVRSSEIPAIVGTILQAEFDMLRALKNLGGTMMPQIELMDLLAKTFSFLVDLARATNLYQYLISLLVGIIPVAPKPSAPTEPEKPPEAPVDEPPEY
jgi:hypothetical protein